MLVLSEPFDREWANADAFAEVDALDGVLYREVANRRTFRFVLSGRSFFAKVHGGVGWREILKNLVVMKWPVVGAWNEFEACELLRNEGRRAPRGVGFGSRGSNPARRRSFVLLEDLSDYTILEDLTADCRQRPPSRIRKCALIDAVGRFAARFHAAGINHRDFYICHLLAKESGEADYEIAVIDLHRAQIRDAVPRRWRKRDLAALLFSTRDLPLSRADRLRFVRAYASRAPAAVVRENRAFWDSVAERASKLEPEPTQ